MLARLASLINRRPLILLIIGLIILIGFGVYGAGVFPKLSSRGFQDPSSESTFVSESIAKEFKRDNISLIALFSSEELTAKDPVFQKVVLERLETISKLPETAKIQSYYTTGQASLISKDQHKTYAAITLKGDSKAQQEAYRHLLTLAEPSSKVQVRYGGEVPVTVQINDQINADLAHAETLSFPILIVLLILFFGSVTAGLMPPLIGALSIIGALFIVRILTTFMDISVYSINVIILLGLGLAVDYSLFLISRFREELNQGKSVDQAITDSMTSAGRTILFSGATVILSLLSLLVFPQSFLKSMGLGGAAAIIMSMILAVTILPLILRLLGHRINSLRVPYFGRRLESNDTSKGIWYRFSYWVMHRPVFVLLGTLAILLLLGTPFLKVQFSTTGVESVPTSFTSRQVSDILTTEFSTGNSDPIAVLVETNGSPLTEANLTLTRELATQISKVEGVAAVHTVEYQANTTALPAAQAVALLSAPAAKPLTESTVSDSKQIIQVYQKYDSHSPEAQQLVKDLRALTPPEGTTFKVGGSSAQLVDLLISLGDHIWYALVIAALATGILLFLMLGSIIIPIKAVIINFLSLVAAYGVLVWVFQGGHLASIGLPATGSIDATEPVLIFAIAFGLAMDYELFLLSRIKESYDQTKDNVTAVATGVQKTASIITSAALMMVIVIGLFATGKISLIQQIGVGLGMAVLIDATVVRILLVPAAMRLMGDLNWWAPAPLARLSEKLGLKE